MIYDAAPVALLVGIALIAFGVLQQSEDAKVLGAILLVGGVAARWFLFGSN